MTNVRTLRHPQPHPSFDDELNGRIVESQLLQQRVLTWVLGALGVASVTLVVGVAVAVWRIALTIA